uniref:Uncharacterized protein LOC113792427 n=1 Tax=Dermatophagoides pteronyssinus TaxID=6956 RepID=A0A6P6XYI5_DERPT|nr:uncharacterized protein LOC113792427 [Dermatophagoides pteronyssinus]
MADSTPTSTADNKSINNEATLAQRRQRRSTSNLFNQQQQQSSTTTTTTTTTRKSTVIDNLPSKSTIKSDNQKELDDNDNDAVDDNIIDKTISEQLQKHNNCRWSLTEPLEACDIQGNWYPAKIVEIKNDKVKIHFLRWKKRYDQWFCMDTDLIRPRSDTLNQSNSNQMMAQKSTKFDLNEEILARWTDQKYYPARITTFYSKGQYCQVLFYDGYRKKVKVSSLQKMPDNYEGEQIPPPPPLLPIQPITSSSLPTTPSMTPGLNLETPESMQKFNNSFVCDICQKGFRKESLLLQHKKHFHKTELGDDVPSLVPPQLRIHKTNRQHDKHSKTLDSGDDIRISKIKTETHDSSEDAININESLDRGKRKNNESTPSPQSNDSIVVGKKIKLEQDHDSGESVDSPKSNNHHNQTKSSTMKSLTVILPGWSRRSSTKPNTTLLFKDAKLEAEEHENDNIEEFVKCICPLDEESGLMVQCELCLAWQHGSCAGFHSENDVPPSGYFCQFCRQAPKSVRTQQNSYQLNHWLKNGQPPQFTSAMFGLNDGMIKNMESVNNKFMNPMMNYINGQHQQQQQQKLQESSMGIGMKKSEMIDNGFFGSEMDIVLHHHHHHHRPMDSDPEDNDDEDDDLQHLRATNQLSSALYDCMVNLHALNYKIQQQREKFNNDEIAEIEEQQQQLLSNMDIIQQKLEKIEKDIEQKDSYAIHTSSSTLSATSPENFGISSDVVMPSLLPPPPLPPTTPIKSTNLFGESNDSSLQNQPTLSALNSTDNNVSHCDSGNNNNDLSQKQLTNDQQSSTSLQPPLARLLLTTTTTTTNQTGNNTGNSSCSSSSHQPNTNHHHRHPSMTHDFLPINLTDGEMKLEISNHYHDLQIARELVLLCSQY